jgi:transcriptional regulator with XRE-family HTH domain
MTGKRALGGNGIDPHIGARLRELRVAAGLSQQALADLIQVTYQQLHEYEAGAKRISAARLYYMAQVLEVDLGAFFEGLPVPQQQVPTPEQRMFLDLARNFGAIRDLKHREAICLLTRILAETGCREAPPRSRLAGGVRYS